MHGSKRLDGHLTKKAGVHWKRRWFTLEDHVITYFGKQGDLRPRGRMVLIPESRVANLPTRGHAFQVITSAKALMVYADTAEERERWIAALDEEIQGLKERALKRRNGRSVRVVKAAGTVFELDLKYELIKPIGHGSSGVVISALDNTSNSKTHTKRRDKLKQVAIKKIPGAFDNLVDTKRVVTEIRLLRHFNHENIMKLVDILPPSSLEDFDDVYVVGELMETDLHRVIYSRQRLTDEHTQYFLYQILCALKYIHSASVLHRDLKPSNVLLNANCDLKLCDFGLSRGLQDELEEGDLTEYVVTRWYRAPELMLSVRNYDAAIDVWSVGCILGEMLGRKPLYAGNDYIQQLKLISALVGKPAESDLGFVTHPRAKRFMLGLPETPPVKLGVKFPDANPDAVDLLSKMLVLDPHRRISVVQALEHPYMASLHDVALEPTAESHVDFRSIERVDPAKHNLRLMVLEDILHFHPECKGLIESSLDAATAMTSAERGGARAPSSPTDCPTGITTTTTTTASGRAISSSNEAAGSLGPTPSSKPPASAAAVENPLGAIADGVRERRQQAVQEEVASRVPVAADPPGTTEAKEAAGKDGDGSPEEPPPWPPEETVGPVFGDRPGWTGDSGDGDLEAGGDKVMLAAVAAGRSEGGSRGGFAQPEPSRFESGAGGGHGGSGGGHAMNHSPSDAADIGVAGRGGAGGGEEEGAMDVDEDGLKTPPEEAKLSRGLDNELPSPGRPTAVAARDAVLTTSLGPGAAIYVSRAYAVELELQDGSLDEEMPLEVTITQGLAFVNCGTEESGRAPFCDDAPTEEFLAMTFVHGPEGVIFPDDKPAKLRFFLGYVDDFAPTGQDDSEPVVISDEEIERDILQSYRPLSSPDGVGTWTTLGKYSVAFRRLLGQREVWVETPVHRFSVTANAMKVDKGAKDQSFFYGDQGRLRWWFKGRSSAPRVRFGNATKNHCATFTCYPIVEHTEVYTESERHAAEIGAVEDTLGAGKRHHSSAVGGALPAAGEKFTVLVENGTYEDCDLSYDVKEHAQMHVRVGVLTGMTGQRLELTRKLQLLEVRKISGNKILVLREPHLSRPAKYEEIHWPCSAEDICRL